MCGSESHFTGNSIIKITTKPLFLSVVYSVEKDSKKLSNHELFAEEIGGLLVFKLSTHIQSLEKDKFCYYTKYPKNWIESLKERFLPGFILKYFPVKYEIIDIKVNRFIVCPHIDSNRYEDHFKWMFEATNDESG